MGGEGRERGGRKEEEEGKGEGEGEGRQGGKD